MVAVSGLVRSQIDTPGNTQMEASKSGTRLGDGIVQTKDMREVCDESMAAHIHHHLISESSVTPVCQLVRTVND